MINRVQKIKEKGFSMFSADTNIDKTAPIDFSRIKVGAKSLEDAVLTLGEYKRINPALADKKKVLEAMNTSNIIEMRKISNFFYKTSGIYSRLCRYMAFLYRYDWMVIPYINNENIKDKKIITDLNKILRVLDKFEVKRFLGEVALKVLRNGCYYGYVIEVDTNTYSVQELPPDYCRSRFTVNGKPAIEFNMKYFDTTFRDATQRMKVLNLFPAEFKKGYALYKEGKLPPDFIGDTSGWYLLDTNCAIKFNINGEDYPLFISVIPAIIDLDEAQELDRKKMMQQLLKIIIQKMPLDKNGDLIFDVDEAQELHNNAVRMLGKAIGIDVLTTFADVDVADMSDSSTTTTLDELEKVERTVYNESGTAQNLFNTDGNIALEKSILNDEAAIYNLLLQFESFLNALISKYNTKKYTFRVQLLNTTIYNYKDMAKLYKEQTQIGYSKFLPQIALGQSQSAILASLIYENDILDLVSKLIPPMSSSTMSAAALTETRSRSSSDGSSDGAGRKEKADDEKSEKTIQNIESQGQKINK